ncbi:uncharacterized protein [Argopecten irradians]|uniref:uncharacterized protein n=1 Tax=Argopecten irradians TaxID=31199 RepID=UPI003714943B
MTYFILLTDISHQKRDACTSIPFPKIEGPRSRHDRIAIIGAGPSGIHMAYRLKEEGYTRVTVFEKNDYIGGKSRTIQHRGLPNDMGTVYLNPDYTEITYITFEENIIRLIQEARPNTTIDEAAKILEQSVIKYIALHNNMFGVYEGVMPRPCPAVLSQLNMSFGEFLRVNDLEALLGIFLISQTSQGYGKLDKLSALYGLMLGTPTLMAEILKPRAPRERIINILSKGFQFLWEEIARQSKLTVKLSSPVTKVYRVRYRKEFYVQYRRNGRMCGEKFDFLITSPFMKSMIDVISFEPEVSRMFKRATNSFFTVTLTDTDYGVNKGSKPRDSYFYNVAKDSYDVSVLSNRDTYGSLNFLIDENYTVPNPGGQQVKTSVYYQFTNIKPKLKKVHQALKDHILNFEQSGNINLIKRITWPYFQRYSVSDMATGILWDIFDLQGKHGMWYIGSSVSVESAIGVVDYNNLLLKQFLGTRKTNVNTTQSMPGLF